MKKLLKNGKILDTGGKRFKLIEEMKEEYRSKDHSGVVHEGGEEDRYPNEGVQLSDIDNMSGNETDEEECEPFMDTRMYLADFSTLMLNALIYRLNKVLGFETLLIISKSGKDLYLLIRASPGDLRVHAQNQEYLLSLEVGYTDIETQPPFSLGKIDWLTYIEPCDDNLNPLNKVIVPDKYQEEVDQYENIIKEQLAHIYKKSKEGTKESTEIDPIELARELGTNDIFEGTGISEETWQTYITFMKVLSKTLKNFVQDPEIEMTKDRIGLFTQKAY